MHSDGEITVAQEEEAARAAGLRHEINTARTKILLVQQVASKALIAPRYGNGAIDQEDAQKALEEIWRIVSRE